MKLLSYTTHSFDILWVCRIIFNFLPQAGNQTVQSIIIIETVLTVQLLAQFPSGKILFGCCAGFNKSWYSKRFSMISWFFRSTNLCSGKMVSPEYGNAISISIDTSIVCEFSSNSNNIFYRIYSSSSFSDKINTCPY